MHVMEVLEGERSTCEHRYETYKVVSWAQVQQMSVAQHYLKMEDEGDSTW